MIVAVSRRVAAAEQRARAIELKIEPKPSRTKRSGRCSQPISQRSAEPFGARARVADHHAAEDREQHHPDAPAARRRRPSSPT